MNIKNFNEGCAKCPSATIVLNGKKWFLLYLTGQKCFLKSVAFELSIER